MQKNYLLIFYRLPVLLAFIMLSIMETVHGQALTPGGSVRLTLLSGGEIDFIFKSMKNYKNGITYNNWTTFGITVRDEPGDINPPAGDDYTNWQLTFQANDADGDGFITGSNPANKLPFSTIEVKATVAAGCATCNVFASPYMLLSNLPATIVDGSALGGPDQIRDFPSPDNLTYGNDKINISYRCGVGTSLLGKPADYYSDEIIFTLIMSP